MGPPVLELAVGAIHLRQSGRAATCCRLPPSTRTFRAAQTRCDRPRSRYHRPTRRARPRRARARGPLPRPRAKSRHARSRRATSRRARKTASLRRSCQAALARPWGHSSRRRRYAAGRLRRSLPNTRSGRHRPTPQTSSTRDLSGTGTVKRMAGSDGGDDSQAASTPSDNARAQCHRVMIGATDSCRGNGLSWRWLHSAFPPRGGSLNV